MPIELHNALEGARMVKSDYDRGLWLAWFGGHGIHAYNEQGQEVAYWNTGSFAQDNASLEAVEESMDLHISGEYEYA